MHVERTPPVSVAPGSLPLLVAGILHGVRFARSCHLAVFEPTRNRLAQRAAATRCDHVGEAFEVHQYLLWGTSVCGQPSYTVLDVTSKRQLVGKSAPGSGDCLLNGRWWQMRFRYQLFGGLGLPAELDLKIGD